MDGDTEVFTWGDGNKGRLGNNSDNSSNTPYLVESLRGARALQIGCGSDFTVMLSGLCAFLKKILWNYFSFYLKYK